MSRKNKYQNIADEECKQAVIFARVSSEEQKKGASIDAQLKTVIRFLLMKIYSVLSRIQWKEENGRQANYIMAISNISLPV